MKNKQYHSYIKDEATKGMTPEEFSEVKEYILDHAEHFDAYPEEVETNNGTLYTFQDYSKYLNA